MAKAAQHFGLEFAGAGEAASVPFAGLEAGETETELIGQQFIGGETGQGAVADRLPGDFRRDDLGGLHQAQGLREGRPLALGNESRVQPFRQVGKECQSGTHGLADRIGKQARSQGPDGFERGETVALGPAYNMVGLWHRQLALKRAGLAGDEEFGADRGAGHVARLEEDQIELSGVVFGTDDGGLSGAPGLAQGEDTHMGCQDFAGREIVSVCDCAQNTPVNNPFGQSEQQVQNASAARDFLQQGSVPGADAGQARQRCEEGSETVVPCFVALFFVEMGWKRLQELFGRHRDNGRFPCSSG